MQKQALCYYDGTDDTGCIWSPLAFSTACDNPPDNPAYRRWAIAMWIRWVNGSTDYWDAGDPTDPNPPA